MRTLVFFRNDDVNTLEPGLVEMTEMFLARGIPVSHAVEPANLTNDVRDWLMDLSPRGVEIIQHGYAHTRHDRGEFGGQRPATEQKKDIDAGLAIMREAFGDRFYPAMSFPFGLYNEHTPPLLEAAGYEVMSNHRRHQYSRQIFYALGRVLRRGRWLGKHVSHHLGLYPGTRLLEVSVSISPIRRYRQNLGSTACEFYDQAELEAMFRTCRRQSPVVGIVLHHRFHPDGGTLDPLARFVDWIAGQPEVEFADITRIAGRFRRS